MGIGRKRHEQLNMAYSGYKIKEVKSPDELYSTYWTLLCSFFNGEQMAYKSMNIYHVQSTTHLTIHFGLFTALISKALALKLN
jgi:hypothetical protein